MASNDSIKKTITVTVLLCIVCSVVVSTAAVLLRPTQEKNKSLDFKRNILAAAGLTQEVAAGKSVEEVFNQRVSTRAVDFSTGTFTDSVDPSEYEQRKAGKDPARSKDLSADEDIAKIGRREEVGLVYMVEGDGGLDTIVLPIRGYGLWSTLYGFMALDSDLNTVVGLGFYEHGETPGLGGEVDNPAWKQLWEGKEVYGENGNPQLTVLKGKVDENTPNPEHKVDGLYGATLTSRGVANLVQFWLGEEGYKPFLTNLKKGEA